MSWSKPIIDREQSDVNKVEEYEQIGYVFLTDLQKLEWLRGMIGALNATDLNRIESNVQFIFNLLSGNFKFPSKTNWSMTEFVKDSDEDRILSNLKILLAPFDFSEDFLLPDKPLNYYEKINIIENILLKMYNEYYSNIEYFELKTDENENFIVDNEKFIVADSKLRKNFETNQDEIFKVSDGLELIVFN